MPKQIYKWKRFWCPRDAQIDLSDFGYLVDPSSEWGKHRNSELVSLEAIAGIPCLVLSGEPGIGKSQEMEDFKDYIKDFIDDDDQILSLDLDDYSEDKLHAKLFESTVFTEWINGTHHLHLFLDSLDQGWLNILKLPTILVEEFRKLDEEEFRKLDEIREKKDDLKPNLYLLLALQTGFLQKVPKIEGRPRLSRLYLRVACRTTVSSKVQKSFEELWNKNLGIYDLAPLRRDDVKAALDVHGLDINACLEEIDRNYCVPLAIKPITLDFLLKKLQHSNGRLSYNQRSAIYLDGCRELCREPKDETRHPLRPVSTLGIDQRLIIVARIAAITTLCIRSTVLIEQGWGDYDPEKDVLITELYDWSKNSDSEIGLPITRATIQEVLDTALFSSRGSRRVRWAHQTYAEFLAAWYLKQLNFSFPQILSLIFHPDGRVVPQLQETVAWLATMSSEVFQKVMETDPDVLLQSDLAITDEEVKASLVESLLKLYNQNKITYQYKLSSYKHLKHPRLPEQLQTYISDSTRSIHSRYIAIDIAEDCNVQAVQTNLANVALDVDQLYWVRIRAAQVLVHIGDENTKAQLKPLVTGEVGNDPEDHLKGVALKAVYPNHMTTEEVFRNITRPKANYSGGIYQELIADELGKVVPLSDLLIALKWLENLPIRRNLHYPFDALSDNIMLKAWEHLEHPEILSRFSQIALLRLSQHDEVVSSHRISFKQLLEENDVKRRQLLEAVILTIPESDREPLWLAGYSEYSQLTPLKQDFLWLIEKLNSSAFNRIQRIYSKLIRWKLDWHNTDQ
ncbi:MAG: hypothetical protein HC878_18415 [Leptolyngbyaceae cyanobacterium SL_5_14]|nr:hypothetical protein [Leptolyngbyaceae cyanobacterium SL_5_14]